MTRFARYSTKGIKRPPLEATPWSELAPPASSTGNSTRSAVAATGADQPTPTSETRIKEEFEGKHSDEMVQGAATPTVKKKIKSKRKRGGLSHTIAADFAAASESATDYASEVTHKMKKKLHGCGEKIDNPTGQNPKKKCSSRDTNFDDDVEKGCHNFTPVSDITEENNNTKTSMKRIKTKPNDGSIKVRTGKRVSTDIVAAELSDVSEAKGHVDDLAEQLSIPPKLEPESGSGSKKPSDKKQKQKKKQKRTAGVTAVGPPLLAEGPLMTQFEGYWVRRRVVPRLERIRAELAAAISDPQTLKREMKKRKRAEHRLLLSQLAARGARQPASAAARLQDKADAAELSLAENPVVGGAASDDAASGDGAEDHNAQDEAGGCGSPPRQLTVAEDRNPIAGGRAQREDRMVKFDGVWMTADAVGRLKELRRQLKMQRVSDAVLKQTMKTARRREEMKRKRDAKRVCLGCRQPGHFVGDCPHRAPGVKAPVTGLCFRCGSTEHRLSECRRPADGSQLPYAVCFVCGKTGHLSRDCSLNPNGVYPRGGACKVCQRRDHLAGDCPEGRQEEAAAAGPRLTTIGAGPLEDDYQHDFRQDAAPAAAAAAPPARQPRRVKF